MSLVAIDKMDWRQGFLWLSLCFIIDAIDGSLARFFNVGVVLPHIEGKSIDFVIDFVTYAFIPAYFFYKASMVSPIWMPILIGIILLSSALYYGKKDMVADGQYFIGFPVLWNFVIFFLFFVFNNIATLNIITIIVVGILHFIPWKYAYPSRSKQFMKSHIIMSFIGIAGAIALLYSYPEKHGIYDAMALLGVCYFLFFVGYDTYQSDH